MRLFLQRQHVFQKGKSWVGGGDLGYIQVAQLAKHMSAKRLYNSILADQQPLGYAFDFVSPTLIYLSAFVILRDFVAVSRKFRQEELCCFRY